MTVAGHLDQRPTMRLTADATTSDPLLEEFANLLRDLALIHDFSVLAVEAPYRDRPMNRSAYRRTGRKPRTTDRLTVERVHFASPLEVVISVPPEQWPILLIVAVIVGYGTAYARALGRRHAEIDADPLGEEIRQAELEHLREEIRSLQLKNDDLVVEAHSTEDRRDADRPSVVIVEGQPMTDQLLQSLAGQELDLLTRSPSYDHILRVLRRLRRLPWALRRIVISRSAEDDEDSPPM